MNYAVGRFDVVHENDDKTANKGTGGLNRSDRVAFERGVAYEISWIRLLEQRFYVDRRADSVRLCSICAPRSATMLCQ